MNKKLKATLIVLLMILIIIIGFGGIYAKKSVLFDNILPDYELGSNLEGAILTTLVIDETLNEEIYDKDGNKVDAIPEGEDEANYTKEQVPVNSDETKTKENYKLSKEIMTERLRDLGVTNYEMRLDEESGVLSINLKDSNTASTVLANILQVGKFEVIDTDNKNVLMDNTDIKDVLVLYNQDTSGVTAYLDMQFTTEGRKKLEQISKDYATDEDADKTSEGTEENTEESNEESAEETAKEKTITINIDGQEFLSTAFDEPIANGRLTISIGSATTNTDILNENISTAQKYAAVLGNGNLPLTYTVGTSEYIPAEFSEIEYRYGFIAVIALLALISIVYMIIRYRKAGLLSSVVYVATIALFLIIIRYTRTQISLEFAVPALIAVLLNTIVNCRVLSKLSKEDTTEERLIKLNKEYIKLLDIIIVALIPAIIFTYNASTTIASTGMALFWGIMCIVLMNGVFTRKLLVNSVKNKK